MAALGVVCLCRPEAEGQAPAPPPALSFSGATSTDALAGSLRRYLAEHIPPVLLDDARGWGRQKLTARGPRNHGVWRKVRVTADKARDTLAFDLRDARQAGPGRMTFTTLLAFDARVEYEQQNWRWGVRLYSGSVRARLRLKLALSCEVTSRVESSGYLPELVFRLRVLGSDLRYDNFVVEHVGGVGGDLAKLLGKAAHGALNQWRPSLERNLLAKANAAIVKAGDTRDVRVGLGKLFGK